MDFKLKYEIFRFICRNWRISPGDGSCRPSMYRFLRNRQIRKS
nr:MAG TPA: hypothetical protein [Caudoviricetes sp.]